MRKVLPVIAIIALSLAAACSREPGVSDDEITNLVEERLKNDQQLGAADIDVRTNEGIVTLEGKVVGQQEATRAVEVARSVEGVKSVNSELKIDTFITDEDVLERTEEMEDRAEGEMKDLEPDSEAPIDDATITAKVKMKFADDETVSALSIDVDTTNQVVTLTGDVKSREEAEKAIQLAQSVEGVKDVNSVLQIKE